MGNFTDGMVNLVDAIHVSHGMREESLSNLSEGLLATMNKFRADRQEMASNQKNQLSGFMTDLRASVGSMKMEFNAASRGLQADLRGAHNAWFGPKPTKKSK